MNSKKDMYWLEMPCIPAVLFDASRGPVGGVLVFFLLFFALKQKLPVIGEALAIVSMLVGGLVILAAGNAWLYNRIAYIGYQDGICVCLGKKIDKGKRFLIKRVIRNTLYLNVNQVDVVTLFGVFNIVSLQAAGAALQTFKPDIAGEILEVPDKQNQSSQSLLLRCFSMSGISISNLFRYILLSSHISSRLYCNNDAVHRIESSFKQYKSKRENHIKYDA